MKTKHRIIIAAAASSFAAFAAAAQETPGARPDASSHSSQSMSRGMTMVQGQLGGAAKASELIGLTVRNLQNDKLGEVEDLAIDVQSGRLVYVVISAGGMIGIGEKLHAVPPGALHHDVAKKVVRLDADKEKFKAAPKFAMSKWKEFSDSEQVTAMYRHYGAEPDFTVATSVEGRAAMPERSRDGTQDKDRMLRETNATKSWSRVSNVQQASKLMGLAVKNRQDEKIGKVENLMVDLPAGRVVAVIVSSGGFIGMGDALSAVPPTAFRLDPSRDYLELDASKESLGKAPHFKADQWPNLGEVAYTESVYRAYQTEPYFLTPSGSGGNSGFGSQSGAAARANPEADNTARNVRDRNNNSLTPLDQGNSKPDVEITARIRKEILDGKGMSMNGRNVKIITDNGKVTLRGPVATDEEKRIIGEIAGGVARMANVDNQLEVK